MFGVRLVHCGALPIACTCPAPAVAVVGVLTDAPRCFCCVSRGAGPKGLWEQPGRGS